MPIPILIPILVPILILLSYNSHLCSSLSPDGLALLAFKSAVTSDPYSAFADWLPSSDDPCHWSGITCANISGYSFPRVVSVTVPSKNLTGYLPSEVGTLAFLRRINLHGNFLFGEVPSSLSNATSLHSVFLYSNNFSGGFPVELCGLPRLQNLDLSRNSFSGEIPPGIRNCRQLQRLVLGQNQLSGELPAGEWTAMTNLVDLDLSENKFAGRIPAELGQLQSMTGFLNLSYNNFAGEIPVELGNLPAVVSLDFRDNKLSGAIPRVGALESQGAVCFLGNSGLCGDPLPVNCKFPAEIPARNTSGKGKNDEVKQSRKGLSTTLIALISAADAIGVAAVGLAFIYIYWKVKDRENGCSCTRRSKLGGDEDRNRPSISSFCCFHTINGITKKFSDSINGITKKFSDSDELSPTSTPRSSSSEPQTDSEPKLVALDKGFKLEIDELLRSSAYVLGKSGAGGFLYKVVLGNGMAVVVRRLGDGGAAAVGGSYREFAVEVEAIGKVRHPNVVRLRAYYWSYEEKLVVTDFLNNGSLATALKAGTGQPCLSWAMRLRIAQGTARGLAYLHDCSPRKFVHGNVKPTNILLDENFNPQISDFGLPRLMTIAGDSTTTVSGPINSGPLPYLKKSGPIHQPNNYRAPEGRFPVGRPNQKWDVYSFGVVLLELLTGRSPEFSVPSPTSPSTSTSSPPMVSGELVRWVRNGFDVERPLLEMVDDTIVKELSRSKKEVVSLFHLALSCTETNPDSRPKMKTVSGNLDRIIRT